MVRTALEQLYDGRCNISHREEQFDSATKQTHFRNITTVSNQPCRLSYVNIVQAEQGKAATAKQVIKLFIAPEIPVKAGARVEVTQNGRTVSYKAAGFPAVYTNHQEVVLELADDYA